MLETVREAAGDRAYQLWHWEKYGMMGQEKHILFSEIDSLWPGTENIDDCVCLRDTVLYPKAVKSEGSFTWRREGETVGL